jgi:hypothetical protein
MPTLSLIGPHYICESHYRHGFHLLPYNTMCEWPSSLFSRLHSTFQLPCVYKIYRALYNLQQVLEISGTKPNQLQGQGEKLVRKRATCHCKIHGFQIAFIISRTSADWEIWIFKKTHKKPSSAWFVTLIISNSLADS